MLYAIEPKKLRYVMTMILGVGGNMQCMMTPTFCIMPLKKCYIYIYIWIYDPTNGAKYLVKGNNIMYLSVNG